MTEGLFLVTAENKAMIAGHTHTVVLLLYGETVEEKG